MTESNQKRPAFRFYGDWSGQIVATAIHNGHDLVPEIGEAMQLDEQMRFREEDPFTARIAEGITSGVVVDRSRFEVDLNRSREESVYRRPEDCWGLEVWRESPLDERLVEGSLAVYDDFYAQLGERLDRLAERGPFVLYDVHSYNHRREGPDEPDSPAEENPEVNVGTGALDRDLWAPVVDAFTASLEAVETSAGRLDVRENIRFKGGHLSRWVRSRYPETGCALALEFKKTFMDEWTGVPEDARIAELTEALAQTTAPVLDALRKIHG